MEPITVTLDGKDRENAMRLAQLMGKSVDVAVSDLIAHELALRTPPAPEDVPAPVRSPGFGPSTDELEHLYHSIGEEYLGP